MGLVSRAGILQTQTMLDPHWPSPIREGTPVPVRRFGSVKGLL